MSCVRDQSEILRFPRNDKRDGFYEHSLLGVVLLRRETWRHRTSSAEHSVRHSATSHQWANCQTRAITRHKALSAASICALAHGHGALRFHPALFREH